MVDEFRNADFYSVELNGSNLASGVYFYRIFSEGIVNGRLEKYSGTMRLVLVK